MKHVSPYSLVLNSLQGICCGFHINCSGKFTCHCRAYLASTQCKQLQNTNNVQQSQKGNVNLIRKCIQQ